MAYSYSKLSSRSFEEALDQTKQALQEHGFGVLTEIDVQSTLKEKLGIDYDEYRILGACHPVSAHQALEADKHIGLLLPCNVIVFREKDQIMVAAILPTVAMAVVANSKINLIAQQIEASLKKVIDDIN